MKIKAPHALQWVFEPLEGRAEFLQKKMFGCQAAYFRGRLCLVVADGEEPWNGLLVSTERNHHSSLQKEFTALEPHRILGKWLYVSQANSDFESIAAHLVERVLKLDPRIGVEPKPKSSRKKPKPARRKRGRIPS